MIYSWSPYGEEGEQNACGIAEADDESYWYMGYTECFRANAAYSLYGILAGEEDQGCNKHTFINSFFTTQGLEVFTQSVELAGVSFSENDNYNAGDDQNGDDGGGYPGGVTSECYYEEDENDANEEDDNDEEENNQKITTGAVSFGLGCSSRSFVQKTYQGAYCDGRNPLTITDHLVSFNKELSDATCIPIFQSNSGNDDNAEDGSDSLTLLYNSRACDINEFPRQCPDPYGKLKAYARATSRATARSNKPVKEIAKEIFSWIVLALGILLMIASIGLWIEKREIREARERIRGEIDYDKKKRKRRRSRSRTLEKSPEKGGKSRERSRGKSLEDKQGTKEEKNTSFWKRIRDRFFRRNVNS
jgi:hypothetical protein